MSGWNLVELAECCEVVSGATPKTSVAEYWNGDIYWATPKDLSELEGMYISDTPRKITDNGLKSCAATILPPNSVLFSSRAPIGHVAINTVPMATNQGFKSFIPDAMVIEAKYLYYWLRANRSMLESLGNGATFKEVSKSVISRVKIPLPPLDEQRRIADILDKADALRTKRQQAIEKVHSLAESIFLEMFGDPATNPKRWPVKTIFELGNVITGNTPPRSQPDNYGDEIEWIKSNNIVPGKPYLTDSSERLSNKGKQIARIVPAGSVLVTCIAGSPSSIGNVSIANREVAFNQQINAIVPTKIETPFLYFQIRVGKRLIQNSSTASMKGMVSKSRFEQIPLISPPIDLQKKFGKIFDWFIDSHQRYHSSLQHLNELFASLQQRAFRGELTDESLLVS